MTKVDIIYLNKETVLLLQAYTIEKFGGLPGVRDNSLLDSALGQPMQTFDSVDLYPTLIEKAACYAYGIIKNHPFVDGNKRAGTAVLGAFLRANGALFKPRHTNLQATILAVARGSLSYEELVTWVNKNIREE
jgi:death-on-curing protein